MYLLLQEMLLKFTCLKTGLTYLLCLLSVGTSLFPFFQISIITQFNAISLHLLLSLPICFSIPRHLLGWLHALRVGLTSPQLAQAARTLQQLVENLSYNATFSERKDVLVVKVLD